MPISGLLLTLKPSPHFQAQTLAALRGRPEIEVGQMIERWLPVAVDVADDATGRDLHDWITALPAVEFVDVVSVHFDSTDEEKISAEAGKETLTEVQTCR